ncbi:o-succinylbenzoate synthase [Phormidium tenue FACHB-886]|nr:o-succinylbenzoate synthase [Phormidium tenue FACHB-886]
MSRLPASLEFRSYRRPFKSPLRTAHGLWCLREGILLRLTDAAGRVGWGEIAPIVEFGTESMGQAIQFCRSLPAEIMPDLLSQIPASLPACQFGLESAWETLAHSPPPSPAYSHSYLLPTGAAALLVWQSAWQSGVRTFKWKIGVAPLHEELSLFEQLVTTLPAAAQLRLDANGGLNWEQAIQWLRQADRHRKVEFLEQPLPPDQFDELLKLSDRFSTPIALDESVTTVEQLEAHHQQGWRGIVVVKAALAGSPNQLRQVIQANQLDVVWSTAFETAIGRQYIQSYLIPSVPDRGRAIGFGVKHWFENSALDQSAFEQAWKSLAG